MSKEHSSFSESQEKKLRVVLGLLAIVYLSGSESVNRVAGALGLRFEAPAPLESKPKTQRLKRPGAGESDPKRRANSVNVNVCNLEQGLHHQQDLLQEQEQLEEFGDFVRIQNHEEVESKETDSDPDSEEDDSQEDEESRREKQEQRRIRRQERQQQQLIQPRPQEAGLIARISELLCSLFLTKYMDVYEPVAYNTRSRQRKRKGSLIKGLKTPVRKPRTVRGKAKGRSATVAADELIGNAKENVLIVSNVSDQDSSTEKSEKARRGAKSSSRAESSATVSSESSASATPTSAAATPKKEGKKKVSRKTKGEETEELKKGDDQAGMGASDHRGSAVPLEDPGQAPGPSGDIYVADVVEPEDLTKIDGEDEASRECERLDKLLDSEEWSEQHDAATLLRRLVTFHPEETKSYIEPNLKKVLLFLKQSVESLRSAQSRNALYAIQACFHNLEQRLILDQDTMQAVVDAVIIKSVNDKRFIASAGEAVLDEMVAAAASIAVLKSLLFHSTSKSAKVCTVVSKYATICLRNLAKTRKAKLVAKEIDSSNDVFADDELAKTLVTSFADLESSRSVDAKKPAQESLRILHAVLRKERFEELAKESLSSADASQVLSIVQKATQRDSKKPSIKEMMAAKRREMMKKQQQGSDGAMVVETVIQTSSKPLENGNDEA